MRKGPHEHGNPPLQKRQVKLGQAHPHCKRPYQNPVQVVRLENQQAHCLGVRQLVRLWVKDCVDLPRVDSLVGHSPYRRVEYAKPCHQVPPEPRVDAEVQEFHLVRRPKVHEIAVEDPTVPEHQEDYCAPARKQP